MIAYGDWSGVPHAFLGPFRLFLSLKRKEQVRFGCGLLEQVPVFCFSHRRIQSVIGLILITAFLVWASAAKVRAGAPDTFADLPTQTVWEYVKKENAPL